MKRIAVATACVLLAGGVEASNLPTSYIQGGIGSSSYDGSLVVDGERYDGLDVEELNIAYQLPTSDIALTSTQVYSSDEGPDTSIFSRLITVGAALPVAVNDRLDVIPEVAFVWTDIQICGYAWCADDEETGIGYGVSARTWLAPEILEISAGWQGSSIDGIDSIFSLGLAVWFWENNSIRLQFRDQENQSVTTVGYRYSWE